MKFSYSLIKKIVPGVPSAAKLAEKLNLFSFEVEEVAGDMMDIKIPANRWSGAAHHIGVARECAAIYGLAMKDPVKKIVNAPERRGLLAVKVDDTAACPRYMGRVFDIPRIGKSPAWMQKALTTCGMKPINAVVDIMNFVMLEVGQPLHSFDAATLAGKEKKTIVVRRARKGEEMETLDGKKMKLDPSTLLITDGGRPLAIAGIKGGQDSGVTAGTRRIVVEAAAFDPVLIYKTVRKIGLATDASARFQHDLSPSLAERGIDRATVLLKEICGARLVDSVDALSSRISDGVIDFDPAHYEKIVGAKVSLPAAKKIFSALGFETTAKKSAAGILRVRVPSWRNDVSIPEDLVDEVVRLSGLSALPPAPPRVALRPATEDDAVIFKDRVRSFLTAARLSEIYNYSFVSKKDLEMLAKVPNCMFGNAVEAIRVANPISEEKEYMRPSLLAGILGNCESNARYFDEIRIFETGKVFGIVAGGYKEKLSVAAAIAAKKNPRVILEIKGIAEDIVASFGIDDAFFREEEGVLHLEAGRHILGQASLVPLPKGWFAAILELNGDRIMEMASEKREYKPLPRFPASSRDLTLLVREDVRIGDMMSVMADAGGEILEDIDLVDEYTDEGDKGNQSVTFRFVFQAEDRTLEDKEVNAAMECVSAAVRERFKAQAR